MNKITNSILDEIHHNEIDDELFRLEKLYKEQEISYYGDDDFTIDALDYFIKQNIEKNFCHQNNTSDIFNAGFKLNEYYVSNGIINIYFKLSDLNINSKNNLVHYMIKHLNCIEDNDLNFIKIYLFCRANSTVTEIRDLSFSLDINEYSEIEITPEIFNSIHYPNYCKTIRDKLLYTIIIQNPEFEHLDVAVEDIINNFEYFCEMKEIIEL